ncbi:MAG: sensor histidine kinase [Proteobacteria bacterium]|nr:sensor histidine kinase [Pseudomonadota bacterium]
MRLSMRGQLLLGILLPVLAFVVVNTVSLYREAVRSADVAYDRTLLASAKAIGEELDVAADADGTGVHLVATVPYAALEAFEADNRSRIYYKVSGFRGEPVSGFTDFPRWQGSLPVKGTYAALVDFYNDRYRDAPVRVAVLLQPVAGTIGQGMATIQVAETLELRKGLARQILIDTLWRQAALVGVIVLVVLVVVQRATRPVRALSEALQARDANDLAPIAATNAPRELRPLLQATNEVMARLAHLLEHQKRFVRDTSHQLRTPLAVLQTQVQSALRGDLAPEAALHEIGRTVARATELANQMLALAKVEQLRQAHGQEHDVPVVDWAGVARAVALDLAPLIVARHLDFSIETEPAPVRAHEWALRELTRNLLHNAIKHTPDGMAVAMTLAAEAGQATLTIADSGPGINAEQRMRLFQPFAAGAASSDAARGAGLGLAICQAIVQTLGGRIALDNRAGGRGLAATVTLPVTTAAIELADNSR